MSDRTLSLSFLALEGAHLLRLVDGLNELLQNDDSSDTALARLTPSPYPNDAQASAGFHSATRDDLLDRRRTDAAIVRTALAPFSFDDDAIGTSGDRAIDIAVTEGQVDAWMRTLTTLRLVLATRIGIVDEHAIDGDDPRHGIYDWLGYRLEFLVQAADDLR